MRRQLYLLFAAALAMAATGCKRDPDPQPATAATPAPAAVAPEPAIADKDALPKLKHEAPEGREVAILAGGCFWGMEEILRGIDGVDDTEVGYTGGSVANPTYEVHTGHAEAVRIIFDPEKLSYADLLEKWFFRMHDPTTKNRQGNDVGTSYRSAIFFTSDSQRDTAKAVIARVNASGRWPQPIVTEVVPASAFTRAEDYHQDYLQKNPGGYTCHYLRAWVGI